MLAENLTVADVTPRFQGTHLDYNGNWLQR
jgi:hypothetical protein